MGVWRGLAAAPAPGLLAGWVAVLLTSAALLPALLQGAPVRGREQVARGPGDAGVRMGPR